MLIRDEYSLRNGSVSAVELEQRWIWTKLIIVAGLVWTLWRCRRAYCDGRHCPYVPRWERLRRFEHETPLFVLALSLLFVIGISRRMEPFICLMLILGYYVMTDWNRMRPWLSQYAVMLAALTFGTVEQGVNLCRLVPVCVYFWAGAMKFNTVFIKRSFPWLIGPQVQRRPSWLALILNRGGVAVPVIESLLAVGLLLPLTRNVSVLGLVMMHLYILYSFSDAGHRGYLDVWPWNISMMLSTVVLFWETPLIAGQAILLGDLWPPHLLTLGLLGVLPALGLFCKLDPVLSHGHMCGRHCHASIVLSQSLYLRLPPEVQEHCISLDNGFVLLEPGRWYLQELGIPPSGSRNVLWRVAKDFHRYDPDDSEINVSLLWVSGFFRLQVHQKVYSWSELSGQQPT